MTPKQQTNFRLESELMDALEQVRDREGIPVSEQVRRAIRKWLEAKGVKVKTDRPRANTRKRS